MGYLCALCAPGVFYYEQMMDGPLFFCVPALLDLFSLETIWGKMGKSWFLVLNFLLHSFKMVKEIKLFG